MLPLPSLSLQSRLLSRDDSLFKYTNWPLFQWIRPDWSHVSACASLYNHSRDGFPKKVAVLLDFVQMRGGALPNFFVHFSQIVYIESIWGWGCPNFLAHWCSKKVVQVVQIRGGVEVIWTKSKRTATFSREIFPKALKWKVSKPLSTTNNEKQVSWQFFWGLSFCLFVRYDQFNTIYDPSKIYILWWFSQMRVSQLAGENAPFQLSVMEH